MMIRRIVYNYLRMKGQSFAFKLTENQKLLFDTLLQYKQDLGLKTVMRVAGGWVRDKIMGKQSHDIDITLDDMKGEQFVIMLKKHAETKNQKISSFGVTKFNPDLSKHLETATAKIHGENIDFVNLRSESYNQNSRIPQIQMGTPLTDALRRDFTINSLFYNLDTHQVEDWTQKGLQDIAHKIIRTPLPPLVTFKDDPLRVLRCFRFKARFNFSIEETIYQSLLDLNIHDALRTKVSKERVGIQLAGMLKAQHPLKALEQVFKYKFWNIIFEVPNNSDLKDPFLMNQIPETGFQLVTKGIQSIQKNTLKTQKQLLLASQTHYKRKRYSEQDLSLQILLTFITLPYQGYSVFEGKKSMPLPQHIALNQLKYSAKVSKFIQKTVDLTIQLQKLLEVGQKALLKIRIARWLRHAEEKWQIAIHCLAVLRQVIGKKRQIYIEPIALRQWIFQEGLQDAYLIESYIDGSFLIKKGKKGPIIKTILDNSVLYRILNPNIDQAQFLELFDKNVAFFQNEKSYLE